MPASQLVGGLAEGMKQKNCGQGSRPSFSKRKGNKEIVLDFIIRPTVQYIPLSPAVPFFLFLTPTQKLRKEVRTS